MAMCHTLKWFIRLQAHGLDRQMSYALLWSMAHLPVPFYSCVHPAIDRASWLSPNCLTCMCTAFMIRLHRNMISLLKVFYMLVFWWLLSEVVDICVRHTVLESCYINWRYVASCRCVFFTCNEMMNFHRWTRAVVVSTSTTLKLVVIKLIWFALSSQFFTFTQPLLTYTYKNTSSFLRKKCESLKNFFWLFQMWGF